MSGFFQNLLLTFFRTLLKFLMLNVIKHPSVIFLYFIAGEASIHFRFFLTLLLVDSMNISVGVPIC